MADLLQTLGGLSGIGALCFVDDVAMVDVTDHPAAAAEITAQLDEPQTREWAAGGRWYETTTGRIGGVWPVEMYRRITGPPEQGPATVPGDTGGWLSGSCAPTAAPAPMLVRLPAPMPATVDEPAPELVGRRADRARLHPRPGMAARIAARARAAAAGGLIGSDGK